MKKFVIRDREAGNEITDFNTMAEAIEAVELYERADSIDGTFEPDFYEIVEVEK